MTEKTMTTREFYAAVLDLADTGAATDPSMTFGGKSVVDISNKASELIAALDARNEKRKSTESKEKKEAAARREQVLHFLTENEGAFTREQIAEAVGFEPSKVTGACTALVKEGLVSKSKVKVDKTEKMAYSAI